MMSRLADLAVSTTFAGSLLLANTSCATRHPDGAATSAPRSETQVPGVQRLVQLSFGTQAAFGICVEPACPAVTPKTLSMAGTAQMQAVAHRVASTADAAHEPGLLMEMASVPLPAPSAPAQRVDTTLRSVVVVFPFASAQLTAPARTALSTSIHHARQSDHIVISGRTDWKATIVRSESFARLRAIQKSTTDPVIDLSYLADACLQMALDIGPEAIVQRALSGLQPKRTQP